MERDRLLRLGYFPKELPPPFQTRSFADLALTGVLPELGMKYISRPCLHNLARPGNRRRLLSIPSPVNYYHLCYTIAENRVAITDRLSTSRLTKSFPLKDETDRRAYIPSSNGKTLNFEKAKNRAGYRFVLTADISRFYYSIYTHIIPWALRGRAWGKSNRWDKGFENQLDKLMQNAQDGQTLGIPVGPDASFIVSEIIACAIDEALQSKKLSGYRFVDDYELVFRSRSQAEKGLVVLENTLRDWELALNPSKVSIDQLPLGFELSWRKQIRSFRFNRRSVSQRQLIEYFDLLFNLRQQYNFDPVLRYGISRLSSCDFENINTLKDLLFQCIPAEAGALKESITLLIKAGFSLKSSDVSSIINSLLLEHGPLNHGSEVAWALWTAVYFKVHLTKRSLDQLEGFNDSIVALLALHADSIGLTKSDIKPFWSHLMTPESLTDGNWLITYEAKQQGWLPSDKIDNVIEKDPFFGALNLARVSFYSTDTSTFYTPSDLDEYGSVDEDEHDDANEYENDFEEH